MKMFRRILAVGIAVSMAAGVTAPVFAANAEIEGRALSVFRVTGDNVSAARGTGRAAAARSGLRLGEGYSLSTGADSSIYIRVDDESLVKMDQNSEVSVISATRAFLALAVERGRALVNVAEQSAGSSIQARIGNAALTVRGTLFVIGHDPDGFLNITMLDGSGDVSDEILGDLIYLEAGYVFRLCTETGEFTVKDLDLTELDAFTLQAVLDYQEMLLSIGVISEDDIELARKLLEERIEEAANVAASRLYMTVESDEDELMEYPELTPEPGLTQDPENEPGVNQPSVTRPDTGRPSVTRPGTGQPDTGLPGTGLPGTGTELPGTGLPGTETPGTESPDTELPEIDPVSGLKICPIDPDVLLVDQNDLNLFLAFVNTPAGLSSNFRLAGPITMGPNDVIAPVSGGYSWVSGVPTLSDPNTPAFTGRFYGDNHIITVDVNTPSAGPNLPQHVVGGLFGRIGPGGTVENLVIQGEVRAQEAHALIGGVAGWNEGTIQNVNVLGNTVLTGVANRGSVAGVNTGNIIVNSSIPFPTAINSSGGSTSSGDHPIPDGTGVETFTIQGILSAGMFFMEIIQETEPMGNLVEMMAEIETEQTEKTETEEEIENLPYEGTENFDGDGIDSNEEASYEEASNEEASDENASCGAEASSEVSSNETSNSEDSAGSYEAGGESSSSAALPEVPAKPAEDAEE